MQLNSSVTPQSPRWLRSLCRGGAALAACLAISMAPSQALAINALGSVYWKPAVPTTMPTNTPTRIKYSAIGIPTNYLNMQWTNAGNTNALTRITVNGAISGTVGDTIMFSLCDSSGAQLVDSSLHPVTLVSTTTMVNFSDVFSFDDNATWTVYVCVDTTGGHAVSVNAGTPFTLSHFDRS